MATEQVLQTISANAGSSLTSNQYCAVTLDTTTAGSKVAVSAYQKNCDGILQNAPGSGQPAQIAIFGISKVQVSATVTTGQLLMVDNTGNGSLMPVTSTNVVVAKALEGSGTISSGTVVITALILKSAAVYS